MSKDAVTLACVICSSTSNLKRCTRCKSRIYCGREHQILDWKTHKNLCGKSVTNTSAQYTESDQRQSQQPNGSTDSVAQSQTSTDHVDTHKAETDVHPTNTVGTTGENNSTIEHSKVVDKIEIEPDTKTPKQSMASETENCKSETGEIQKENLDNDGEIPFDKRKFKKMKFCKPPSLQYDDLAEFAVDRLNKEGFCVVDGYFEKKILQDALKEIKELDNEGELKPGKLSGGRTSGDDSQKVTKSEIRSDRILWLQGDEDRKGIKSICQVVEQMDFIVAHFNTYLEENLIDDRTKAMVACYPGDGSFYRRHIDNPLKDGRLVTAILYLNSDWNVEEDGGLLRIFPKDTDEYVDIEPLFNRLLFFWSDRRNPHEVQPAYKTRYGVTIWFYDQYERKLAKEDEVNAELANVNEQLKETEIKVKEMEKMAIEQKIENEAIKAVNALTEGELMALTVMTREHPNPSELLSQLGIDPVIQNALLRILQGKFANT